MARPQILWSSIILPMNMTVNWGLNHHFQVLSPTIIFNWLDIPVWCQFYSPFCFKLPFNHINPWILLSQATWWMVSSNSALRVAGYSSCRRSRLGSSNFAWQSGWVLGRPGGHMAEREHTLNLRKKILYGHQMWQWKIVAKWKFKVTSHEGFFHCHLWLPAGKEIAPKPVSKQYQITLSA